MKAFSVAKFDDQEWLFESYKKLHQAKSVYSDSFFLLLIVTFFLFLAPLEKFEFFEISENFIWIKMAFLGIFIVSTIGWYSRSIEFYNFCAKFLNYQFQRGFFPEKITYQISDLSEGSIRNYILFFLVVFVLIIIFGEQYFHLEILYWWLSVLSGGLIFSFLLRIESFYERRAKIREVEFFTEAIIFEDPLHIVDNTHKKLGITKQKKKLKETSFARTEATKELSHPDNFRG